MTLGIAGAGFADPILTGLDTGTVNLITSHAQPHTADPGAAGTTAVFSSVTTQRSAITWGAASGTTTRQRAASNVPTWAVTGTGTVSHMSLWNASSAGTFRGSFILTEAKPVANGDTLNLTSLVASFTPVAT